MWRKIECTPPFYLQLKQSDVYEILVTDYITLYSVQLSREEFLSLLKSSNPKLITTDENLIDDGTNMLQRLEELEEINVNKEDCNLIVHFTSKVFDYPLRIKLVLQEATKENFFKNITSTLLTKVVELQSIKQNLGNLIKEKDKEINYYKLNGGKIQKYLRTPIFNKQEHLKEHDVYQIDDALLEDLKVDRTFCSPEKIRVETTVKEEKTEELDGVHSRAGTEIKREIKNESESPMKKRIKKFNF